MNMDINVNKVIFESDGSILISVPLPLSIPDDIQELMKEFLSSGYFTYENSLNINRFLLDDLTIDLEKLELGISLAILYLENFNKNENRIYINLGNIGQYFDRRGSRAKENKEKEMQFILGFCQSVANEETIERPVEIRYV